MENISVNKYTLRDKFFNIVKYRPLAKELIDRILEEGDILLFGGAVREFFNNNLNIIPRDIDLVVNSMKIDLDEYFQGFPYSKNRFDGYKIFIDDIVFDIWSLASTWAFKEKKILDVSKENLPKTVFLNYDSIVYNLWTGDLYDEGFFKAKKDKTLDIVLEENPFPELNVLRSFVFKKYDQMRISNNLLSYIYEWGKKNHGHEVELLLNIQRKHYGKELIKKDEIEKELSFYSSI